jgi:hypothetical protein
MDKSLDAAFEAWALAWRKEALAIGLTSIVLPFVAYRPVSEERMIKELALIPK